MYDTDLLDTETAFQRYEAVRERLPSTTFETEARLAETLAGVAEEVDGFILDAFGVLNVGEVPIPGALERMAALRSMGKELIVLTNAASYPRAVAQARYQAMGFDFALDEVVSSRDVAATALADFDAGYRWAGIAAEGDDFSDLDADVADLLSDDSLWQQADGFLFLSSIRWVPELQERLVSELARAPRPLVVANPDLVAPRGDGLSVEPGYWAHDVADRTSVVPVHFGKPFVDAFAVARARMSGDRIAMVGDTLHTDILGGRAAGLATVLITDHGLFAGHDCRDFIDRSGIVPDWIVKTT